MRQGPPSYLAEPTIQYLFQVLEQIGSGEVQFPRFQRFDVWKPEQRRELLRSILESIPIGTLLLWRTSLDMVKIERRIGMHQLPEPRKGERTRQYVLDGVQRLSTLYGALFPPNALGTVEDGEDASDFRVYYDLKVQDFFVESELEAGTPKAHHLPLTALRDSVALIRFQRGLKGAQADIWTERADAVARSFREYKVPVVPLASDNLAHATRTFQRINTQGSPMSEIHMVNALAYDEDFDLLEKIRETKQERLALVGWEELEDEAVLRTVKALLGIDVYATRPDETVAALKKRPEVVDEAAEALARTANFLRKHWGIYRPNLVPYAAQIVLLARTLHETSRLPKVGSDALKDWIALTTYTEIFGGNMSASRFDALAEELKDTAKGKPLIWSVRRPLTRRELPLGFDFRHARARFLALRLARAGSHAPWKPEHDPFAILAAHGVAAVPQLLSTKIAAGTGAWMRSPGTRFVVAEGSLPTLREHVFDANADTGFLTSHLISGTVHHLFIKQRFEEAVRKREEELNEAERKDFSELLLRHSPLQATASRDKRTNTTRPSQLKGKLQVFVPLPKSMRFK